ncbi:hypothetical protein AKJ63_00660 [candidate division MSBL1 archaeon SCGC-AAA259D18]|uniref:Uncharacterized protein n=1 Tax=candidate division MSBL1 archaeon SCGC-AAA259D18 TaxID=1698262 RepID=A0A133UCD3_9EURY|nr:hypothetical protein AKJ63_00660 [candidate division MSBL1 archaeon SCGC-AAA259D18]
MGTGIGFGTIGKTVPVKPTHGRSCIDLFRDAVQSNPPIPKLFLNFEQIDQRPAEAVQFPENYHMNIYIVRYDEKMRRKCWR